MKPDYIARKSAIGSGGLFWCILFCWLIIPILIWIFKVISAKYKTVEFYDNKVIVRSGVISKSERQSALTNIMAVSYSQSIGGRIFNYGNVRVDVVGRFDVDLNAIKDPKGLKNYLEHRIADSSNLKQLVTD